MIAMTSPDPVALNRRLIAFGGSVVAVEHAGERAAQVVDFLCRHLPGSAEREAQPTAVLRVVEQGEILKLYHDDDVAYTGDDDARLAEVLLGKLGHQLAYHSRGGLLFHAGVLERDGRGLLLPGAIGAGKTTLTTWLALTGLAGLAYLSDEMAFFPHGSSAMQAYTRPLNVKRGARAALGAYFDFSGHADQILSTYHENLIPPELVRFRGPRERAELGLIILPRYVADGELELEPLTGAQAGLALMECLVNARNLSQHGFDQVARLARTAPAYRLRYARFEQVEARIATLIETYL
jgi:hypothetical protein